MNDPGGLPFSYEEFSEWFDRHSRLFLHPAKDAAATALDELLDSELREPQRVRIRVGSGRVKSKARTWKKLNDKYVGRIGAVSEVPLVVDDLVGLRVVCTNKSDVDRLVEIFDSLEPYVDGDEPVLAIHPDSRKDWRTSPKDSGYRAYHINLCTSVPQATRRHPVVCELQLRTLLQDSWGELTHEDTYKPGAQVPPLVDTLSLRMADLMATLDDIAEDLRSELDRLAEGALTEAQPEAERAPDEPAEPRPVTADATRDAAEAYLIERTNGLTRPIALPTLAWELQREFGGEISGDWFGYGTFTKMLEALVPAARVNPTSPSYVLPADFDPSTYDDHHPWVPRIVSLLKEADKSFPLISSEHWPRVYSALALATHQVTWEYYPDVRTLNELSRVARDGAESSPKDHVSRSQVRYVIFALASASQLITNMTGAQIEDAFVGWMLRRATSLGLPQDDSDRLESWLRGKGLPEQSV
jgi:ppGpp synthetase/RelA/SpoT-type nucleotidyltranferase